MLSTTAPERRSCEQWSRDALAEHQLQQFNQMLATILPENGFYANKLGSDPLQLNSLDQLADLPFTFKSDLIAGEHDFAANLTYPVEQYVRFHRTSGTRGRPMVVLDTEQDWQWWLDTWQFVLDSAEVTSSDRALMAFSFGPFVGFWSANDALATRGALVIPGGGFNTLQRIDLARGSGATVVFCTPTYALRMAEVAYEHEIDLRDLPVSRLVVAGEPGGTVPAVRERIEEAWQAKVIDHGGATEVGPWGYSDADRLGLHIPECRFIAEFLSVDTGTAAGEGELSELVLTTLGRNGCPVIRYRTGDLVRPNWTQSQTNRFVLLDGGILGRADDMMIIRGVNVFPSSAEQILRGFPEIVEYRITASRQGEMDSLKVEIEDRLEIPERVADEFQVRLGLSVEVQCVPLGSLPRFEGKGKRFIDER